MRGLSIVWVGAALLVACAEGGGDAVATRAAALKDGDSHWATVSDEMPARATGWLVRRHNGGGSCSGVAVARDVVLTAAHCFCADIRAGRSPSGADWEFHLPYRDADGTLLDTGPDAAVRTPFSYTESVGPDGKTSWNVNLGVPGVGIALHYHSTRCDEPKDERPEDGAGADLAVLVLARPLTATELPRPLPVYTGGDFFSRLLDSADLSFFQGPIGLAGWATAPGKRAGTLRPGQTLFFKSSWRRFQFLVAGAHHTAVVPGDSGSAITFRPHGGPATAFGISSSIFTFDDDEIYDAWSPTYDNGWGNGAFLRPFLEDGDGDGVSDRRDNCPASRCAANPARCANIDQADADGDGVGDVCDNCAPSRCAARGLDAEWCANADQADADGDRVGDVCDGCVAMADGAQYDPDGDGLGACDTCPDVRNGARACRAASDCVERRADGTPTGRAGDCVLGAVAGRLPYGRCDDGTACAGDADCGAGSCREAGAWGRCDRPLDDPDLDGVGDACDTCPALTDATAQVNSNLGTEGWLSVERLGDRCDPVPVFAPRPVVEGALREIDPRREVRLVAAAAIGGASEAPRTFGGDVRLRYCSCVLPDGTVLGEQACRVRLCPTDPRVLDPTRWTAITLAEGATGAPLRRTFSNRIDCSDTYGHPESEIPEVAREHPASAPCRVGELETLRWRYADDVAAGRVPSAGTSNGAPVTAGILWADVDVEMATIRGRPVPRYASARDGATAGALRRHFGYVRTPAFFEPPVREVPLPPDWARRLFVFRPDRIPGGGDPPWLDPVPFRAGPVPLLPMDDGTVLAWHEGQAFDVTSSVAPSLRALLARGDLSVRGPVEPFGAGLDDGAAPAFAVMPRAWRRAAAAPAAVRADAEGFGLPFQLVEEIPGLEHEIEIVPAEDAPLGWLAGDNEFVPGDREGAVSLYSATERAVYLVGGRRDGEPTGEVWRYDVDALVWTPAFHAAQVAPGEDAPRLGDVLAATYDGASGRFVVADEAAGPDGEPVARLLVLDRVRGLPVEVARLRRTGRFEAIELAPRPDGGFVLAGREARGEHWRVHGFRVEGDRVRWDGHASGGGELGAGVHVGPSGVVLPVRRGRAIELLTPRLHARGPTPDAL